MAYIDLDKIGSVEARSIIDRDPALAQLALEKASRDVRIESRSNEVKVEDILLNGVDGCLTSDVFYAYCEERFLFWLFDFVSNTADIEDSYTIKSEKSDTSSNKYEKRLTAPIITEEEVVDSASRNTGLDILC